MLYVNLSYPVQLFLTPRSLEAAARSCRLVYEDEDLNPEQEGGRRKEEGAIGELNRTQCGSLTR
jgi:hypothetical protein